MPIEPIRPSDISDTKRTSIPDYVFDVFNLEIAKVYTCGRAVVKQQSVVDALVRRGHDRNAIFACGWLNVEEAYRDFGWAVGYDKPAYNESGEAYFTFSPKEEPCRTK